MHSIAVTAAIIIHDQQILITQRHPDDQRGGQWEFPGGKIEAGETPEQCLQRELQEELEVLAEIHDLYTVSRHSYPDLDITLSAYRATIQSGQITLHEHSDYRWVAIPELRHFDFCEADRPIVAKLMAETTNP